MCALDAYEELVKLKDDPEAFEKRRKEIMDEAIAECPEEYQKRLTQNNWCLEQELKHYKDPKARMNKMVEVFWKGVSNFQHTLSTREKEKDTQTDSKVVPFKKK